MTAYDGLILNTDNSEAEVPQSGDTYNFPRAATFQSSITFGGVQRSEWGTIIDSGTATSGGASTLTDTGADWGATGNPLAGSVIKITGGTGSGQTRGIASHTGTVITTDSAWTVQPDATSTYEIYGTGNQTLEQVIAAGDLGAIAATLVKNAVAYFVYDTSKDSDGGAWRKRMAHTSWWQELGDFPAKALFVAIAAEVTVYDLTDPTVPAYAVFTRAGTTATTTNHLWGNQAITSIAVKNGEMVVGYGTSWGYTKVSFPADKTTGRTVNGHYALIGGISDRNAGSGFTTISTAASSQLASASVNAVAIAVLDDAPIDSATGLPKSIIRAMTAAGASEITDDSTSVVWDATGAINLISGDVNKDGYTAYASTSKVYIFNAPLTADTALTSADYILDTAGTTEPHISGTIAKVKWAGNRLLIASSTGLFTLTYNPATPAASLLAKTDNAFSTGHLAGANRGAWLANSTTVDRSVHANALTENGTVPVTTVTNGVNQYGPYTAANNHTAASNAEWDVITTGAFYQVLWFKCTGNSAIESLSGFANAGNTIRNLVTLQADGTVRAIDDGATAAVNTDSTVAYDDSVWHQAIFVRASSTSRALYIDGNLVASNTTDAGSLTGTGTLPFAIGVDPDGSTTPATTTSLALVRIGATDITAEQAKYMYETEKPLFATGALALLSAAAVTDLDYNADAEILKVETAAANDFLHGLEVVTRGAALTATTDLGHDYVTVNGTTDIRPSMTARTLRDELADKAEALADAKNSTRLYQFTSSGTTWDLPQGWKADGTIFNVTDGTFAAVTQAFDGFIWTLSGLTTAKDHEVRIRRV